MALLFTEEHSDGTEKEPGRRKTLGQLTATNLQRPEGKWVPPTLATPKGFLGKCFQTCRTIDTASTSAFFPEPCHPPPPRPSVFSV